MNFYDAVFWSIISSSVENTQRTVAHVKSTPYLGLATIFVAAHDDSIAQAYIKALCLLLPNMCTAIGDSIRLKYTPKIMLRSVSYAVSVVRHA